MLASHQTLWEQSKKRSYWVNCSTVNITVFKFAFKDIESKEPHWAREPVSPSCLRRGSLAGTEIRTQCREERKTEAWSETHYSCPPMNDKESLIDRILSQSQWRVSRYRRDRANPSVMMICVGAGFSERARNFWWTLVNLLWLCNGPYKEMY